MHKDARKHLAVLSRARIRSNLQRYLDARELERMEARMNQSTDFIWKTPPRGAATSVLLAASPLVEGVSGRYFEDCNEAEPDRPGSRRGVAPYALDPEAAARLWRVSVEMSASERSPFATRLDVVEIARGSSIEPLQLIIRPRLRLRRRPA